MLSDFKDSVSELYTEWEVCLMGSLKPAEQHYFESICLQTATKAEFSRSLYKLSGYLHRKFKRKVIVLIDEYDAPNNFSFEHGYFSEVRSYIPLRDCLAQRQIIQANEYFGRGVLGILLKVTIVKFRCITYTNIFI